MSALTIPKRVVRYSPPPPPLAMVLVSAELLMQMAEDANPGVTFTVEWGEPRAETGTWYEPTITRHEPQP